jgi:hypothetical protein
MVIRKTLPCVPQEGELALICAVVGFNLCCADSVRAHALSFEGKGDSPWNDERTSLLSGQAIQNLDKPWNDERTSLLSGQAIQNSWDKPSLGTSHSEFLGQARILGTKQLGHIGIVKGIGQALE